MNLRDAARQHHLHRAKIASKLIKYPHIEDYTVGLIIVLSERSSPWTSDWPP
jgi:hypothetical protein